MDVKIYNSANDYNLVDVLKEGTKGYREGLYLARLFVFRNFKAKYKTSYVGFVWEIMPSLTTALVWIFLKGSGAINSIDTAIPFPVFVLVGTIMWSLITESINKPISSFLEYKSIISKINIPKESLLLIGLFNILINHGIKLILVVFLLIFFKIVPTLSFVYFIPITILTIICFMSIGILLLPLEYMLPDITRIKNYGLMALMYLTPVVYANPGKGVLAKIMELNPLTYIIEALRNSITGMPIEHLSFFLWMTILTVILTVAATIVYRIATPIIIQRIGS